MLFLAHFDNIVNYFFLLSDFNVIEHKNWIHNQNQDINTFPRTCLWPWWRNRSWISERARTFQLQTLRKGSLFVQGSSHSPCFCFLSISYVSSLVYNPVLLYFHSHRILRQPSARIWKSVEFGLVWVYWDSASFLTGRFMRLSNRRRRLWIDRKILFFKIFGTPGPRCSSSQNSLRSIHSSPSIQSVHSHFLLRSPIKPYSLFRWCSNHMAIYI